METSNLQTVFDECERQGIIVEFSGSFCHADLREQLEHRRDMHGFVFVDPQGVASALEELGEEGSALVYFSFDGRNATDLQNVGCGFTSMLRNHGYVVDWNPSLGMKVGVVISRDDLPPGFIRDWESAMFEGACDRVIPLDDGELIIEDFGLDDDELEPIMTDELVDLPSLAPTTARNMAPTMSWPTGVGEMIREAETPSPSSLGDVDEIPSPSSSPSESSLDESDMLNGDEIPSPSSSPSWSPLDESDVLNVDESSLVGKSPLDESDMLNVDEVLLTTDMISSGSDFDETLCSPGCICANCMAEREEEMAE